MDRKLTSFLSVAWRGAIVLLTLEIAAVSLMRYFTHSEAPPELITGNAYAHPFLWLHVAGGVTALVLGPLQFVPRIRERFPILHRISGRTYALAVAIGAPAGFILALGTVAGRFAGVGFAIPAILWPIFTYFGVRAAMGGDLTTHRRWMLRSYAITANAITLRLMLPAAGVLGIPFMTAYPVIAWLGWMVNLTLVEFYLHRRQQVATAGERLIPIPAQ